MPGAKIGMSFGLNRNLPRQPLPLPLPVAPASAPIAQSRVVRSGFGNTSMFQRINVRTTGGGGCGCGK